jgi:hypothetical protein
MGNCIDNFTFEPGECDQELTVLEVMELARLCHQFNHYPIIGGCYDKLHRAAIDQASPGAIAEVASKSSVEHHADYFPEYLDDPE